MIKAMKLAATLTVLGMIGAVAPAQAAPYGNIAPPGVYYGTGNFNGNFTIGNTNGIEVALRAKIRGGDSIDGSSGIYQAQPSLPGSNRALWNYDFSINTAGSEQLLSGFQYRLGVDHDPTAGTLFSYVNPLTGFAGNSFYRGPFGLGPITGVQNSENVGFASTPGGAFNVSADGLYTFNLAAFALDDGSFSNPLSQTSILVRVGNPAAAAVPEPMTLALFGVGLLGFAGARRRKA